MKLLSKLTIILLLVVLVLSSCKDVSDKPSSESSDSTGISGIATTDVTEAQISSDDLEDKAESDLRYKWIKAFVDGDSNTCAAIANASIDSYSFISELDITEYSITEIDTTVEFTFEVTDGNGGQIFPDGEYCYVVKNGYNLSWTLKDAVPEDEIPSDLVSLLPFCTHIKGLDNFDDISDDTDLTRGMFLTVYNAYRGENKNASSIPQDELSKGAKLVFSVDDFNVSEEIATYNDGVYTSTWVGGPGVIHKVESVTYSDDAVECVIQYYHDSMYMVKSHKIKITAEKTGDDVYDWKITGIKRIEECTYEPYTYVV